MKEVQSLGDIRFGTLARAAEGLTQWRPLLLAFLTLLLTGVVITLGQWLALNVAGILALVMMLLAFVVLMGGFSGVGIMLMDKAKEQPVRSFAAAASAGLLCLPKFLLIGLAMMAAFIVYMLLASVIYFIGKIPFIGGLIAFIAHPVLVLVFASALVALIWVIGPLMAPALWSGMPVKAAMGNVIAIARKRLIEVVLMEVVLYIILSLIGVMLFAGLVPASFSLTALGASIMGDSNAMMAMAASSMGGRGVSPLGMLYAGGNGGLMAGLGVLYCVVGALVTQVGIMGMNLIYLQARGNLDHSEAEDVLDDFMGDVRQKATEASVPARRPRTCLPRGQPMIPQPLHLLPHRQLNRLPTTALKPISPRLMAPLRQLQQESLQATRGLTSRPMDAAQGESMAREPWPPSVPASPQKQKPPACAPLQKLKQQHKPVQKNKPQHNVPQSSRYKPRQPPSRPACENKLKPQSALPVNRHWLPNRPPASVQRLRPQRSACANRLKPRPASKSKSGCKPSARRLNEKPHASKLRPKPRKKPVRLLFHQAAPTATRMCRQTMCSAVNAAKAQVKA